MNVLFFARFARRRCIRIKFPLTFFFFSSSSFEFFSCRFCSSDPIYSLFMTVVVVDTSLDVQIHFDFFACKFKLCFCLRHSLLRGILVLITFCLFVSFNVLVISTFQGNTHTFFSIRYSFELLLKRELKVSLPIVILNLMSAKGNKAKRRRRQHCRWHWTECHIGFNRMNTTKQMFFARYRHWIRLNCVAHFNADFGHSSTRRVSKMRSLSASMMHAIFYWVNVKQI